MQSLDVSLIPASFDDFAYIYALCENTMRGYVETDVGADFEGVATPAIERLLRAGCFAKILLGVEIVGAIALEWKKTHLQLEELYLEKGSQGRGIGSSVMKHFMSLAASRGLPVRLHVLVSNPARAFYQKLGFVTTKLTGVATYMEYVSRDVLPTPSKRI